jgi:hypothetical protein
MAFANGGAQCDQVDLEQLRQRVAHLEFEVRREAQSRTLCETESSAEDTATETDASGNYRNRDGGRDRRRPISRNQINGVEKNEDKETAQESSDDKPDATEKGSGASQ